MAWPNTLMKLMGKKLNRELKSNLKYCAEEGSIPINLINLIPVLLSEHFLHYSD